MLPTIQVTNKRPYPGIRPRKPPRARPISAGETAATTGLAMNPNGTYIANTYPQSNAAFGAQGAYGSGLPAVNVDAYRNTFQQGAQYGPVGAGYGAINAGSQFVGDF